MPLRRQQEERFGVLGKPPALPRQGAVILAGGRSERFGGDKRRWRLTDGRTLLESTLACYDGLFNPLVLVLRPEDRDWSAGLTGCAKVFTASARLGMGHSLAAGVRALEGLAGKSPGGPDAVFVALGDMPWIEKATLQAMRQAMRSVAAIVRPTHLGAPGHPVGFGRAYFSDLRNLTGDRGAKAVLSRHADKVICLAVNDSGVLRDLDRRADVPARADA